MKKIIMFIIIIAGIGSLMGHVQEQIVLITNSTNDQIITFDKYDQGYALAAVQVIIAPTTLGGFHNVDNDGSSGATVNIELGVNFDLIDNNSVPRLKNDSGDNIWRDIELHETSPDKDLEANDNDEIGVYNDGGPDNAKWSATGQSDIIISDFIGSSHIYEYVATAGSTTFTYTLKKANFINIAGSGGGIYGSYGSQAIGGYVKIIYLDEDPLPVTLSSFTAMFNNDGAFLQWTTQSEASNMGWNIYRSTTGSAEEAAQLNIALIEGAGSSIEPTDYSYVDDSILRPNQTYYYWIEDVSYGNVTTLHGPVSVQINEEGESTDGPEIEKQVQISNYPNPFNPDTSLYYSLKDNEVAKSIEIYNVRGQKVRSFDDPANPQQWDGKDMNGVGVSSGIYMYVLKTSQNSYIKKMVLSK